MKARAFVKAGSAPMLAGLVLAGTISCASPNPTRIYAGGPAGPGYELKVEFHQGVSKKTAKAVLTRCTAHNPVVTRTSALLTSGEIRQYTTKVIAKSATGKQAKQLVSCLNNDKAVVSVGWPA